MRMLCVIFQINRLLKSPSQHDHLETQLLISRCKRVSIPKQNGEGEHVQFDIPNSFAAQNYPLLAPVKRLVSTNSYLPPNHAQSCKPAAVRMFAYSECVNICILEDGPEKKIIYKPAWRANYSLRTVVIAGGRMRSTLGARAQGSNLARHIVGIQLCFHLSLQNFKFAWYKSILNYHVPTWGLTMLDVTYGPFSYSTECKNHSNFIALTFLYCTFMCTGESTLCPPIRPFQIPI